MNSTKTDNASIYVLTEKAMQDVNYLLCVLSRESKDPAQSRLVRKAIDILAQAPSLSKTSRVDELVRTAIYTMGGGTKQ